MSIEQVPFRLYHTEDEKREKPDTFTVRLNQEEREVLNKCKKKLRQKKDSTATKQLVMIGANVLLSQLTGDILEVVFKNKRKNKRIGVADFD